MKEQTDARCVEASKNIFIVLGVSEQAISIHPIVIKGTALRGLLS